MVQDKAAISHDVGECGTQQHKAPKEARIKGWFVRLSFIWYLSISLPCHMGNAKCHVLMRKLQAEHLGIMLHSRRGAGTNLQISLNLNKDLGLSSSTVTQHTSTLAASHFNFCNNLDCYQLMTPVSY